MTAWAEQADVMLVYEAQLSHACEGKHSLISKEQNYSV
jgi:hypothetical protein